MQLLQHALRHRNHGLLLLVVCFVLFVSTSPVLAVVPGTGERINNVGDTFEDPDWSYTFNLPKSSKNIDERTRQPAGRSDNGRWFESNLRGQPDQIQRVATPPNGLPGSEGSLLIRSIQTGVPQRTTRQLQQDDLLLNVSSRMGGLIPVSWNPNCVVRVFLPPFEQWENRTGTSFALRAGVRAYVTKSEGTGFFSRSSRNLEPYWPGIFIRFNSETDRSVKEDSAQLIVRAQGNGGDVWGPKITETGWWTLGMSFTGDGRVHYYASPGVDALSAEDHIASYMPYGYRCEKFNNFFFNVANGDDGRTWSTAWIIDDPELYFMRPGSRTAHRRGSQR